MKFKTHVDDRIALVLFVVLNIFLFVMLVLHESWVSFFIIGFPLSFSLWFRNSMISIDSWGGFKSVFVRD